MRMDRGKEGWKILFLCMIGRNNYLTPPPPPPKKKPNKTGHQLNFQTYQLLYLYQAHFQFRFSFLGVGEMSPNVSNLVSLSCSIQDIRRASQLSDID